MITNGDLQPSDRPRTCDNGNTMASVTTQADEGIVFEVIGLQTTSGRKYGPASWLVELDYHFPYDDTWKTLP
jgi:hypothetical protein